MSDEQLAPDGLPLREFDPENPYHRDAEGALLGLAAHPEDLQAACYASGCESWEAFTMALDIGALLGWTTETGWQQWSLTQAGRTHGMTVLEEEQRALAEGRLTRREASTAHADLLYQHVIKADHPLARKLWEMTQGRPAEPLTPEERECLAVHVEMQSGPIRGDLIDRLRNGAGGA